MAVALFAYRKGNTPLHRMSAFVKLALLVALCLTTFAGSANVSFAFFLSDLLGIARLTFCFLVSVCLFILSEHKLSSIKAIKFVAILGVLVTAFSAICFGKSSANDAVLCHYKNIIYIEENGLFYGLLYTVRLFITSLSAQVIFETTSSLAIKDALCTLEDFVAKILPAIKKLHFALILTLAISFIPTVFAVWAQVQKACKARSCTVTEAKAFCARHGLDANGFATKMRLFVTSLVASFSALFSCLLYGAETKRKALLNRAQI